MRITADLARGLIARQFPQYARLPITQVLPGGIDNRTFRLGDELAIRMPSAEGYAASVAKEQRWLPVIARVVPLVLRRTRRGRRDAGSRPSLDPLEGAYHQQPRGLRDHRG